jgi:hypothetical protein
VTLGLELPNAVPQKGEPYYLPESAVGAQALLTLYFLYALAVPLVHLLALLCVAAAIASSSSSPRRLVVVIVVVASEHTHPLVCDISSQNTNKLRSVMRYLVAPASPCDAMATTVAAERFARAPARARRRNDVARGGATLRVVATATALTLAASPTCLQVPVAHADDRAGAAARVCAVRGLQRMGRARRLRLLDLHRAHRGPAIAT